MYAITIIGAGAMGTAMGNHIAEKGFKVTIWARRGEVCTSINTKHINYDYFPTIRLNKNILCTTNLKNAVSNVDAIIIAVPSHAMSEISVKIRNLGDNFPPVLSVIKGIEYPSNKLPSEIIKDTLNCRIAVLSGPTFALEILQKMPTVAALASVSEDILSFYKAILETDYFRVIPTTDIKGVQFCGVLKNVYAIALAITDGIGLGDDMRGLIVFKAVNEMKSLITAWGGDEDTILGPAGIGDFIATAFSNKSRNRTIGLLIGLGIIKPPVQLEARRLSNKGILAEGLKSLLSVKKIANDKNIWTPILDFEYDIIYHGKRPQQSLVELLKRVT